MALFLFEGLVELAEAATVLIEGAAGAEAVAVEMGVIGEETALLSPLAAAEGTTVGYGAVEIGGTAARTITNIQSAAAAAGMVASGVVAAAEKIHDSVQSHRKRRASRPPRDMPDPKRLFPDDMAHEQISKPAKARPQRGSPNFVTSRLWSPILTC